MAAAGIEVRVQIRVAASLLSRTVQEDDSLLQVGSS